MKYKGIFSVKNLLILTTVVLSFILLYIFRENINVCMNLIRDKERLKVYLDSFGTLGMLVFFIMQIIQVVIFFIPGEVIQAAGGYVFGTFLGTLLSIGGITVGSIILFTISKKFGMPLVNKFMSKKNFHKLEKLLNNKKINLIVFLLYLIPGIPKDSLIFVCGVSRIDLKNFIIYSTLGRIPALFLSSLFGAQVAGGNHFIAITIAIIATTVVLVGIVKREFLLKILSDI
ncbi:TVP38/TMEM64 family protein [Clostridium amazonitimonense]|uniref:TVP38/TMEM64 family protein n=1 Tax=Clostridium amazonitimonense TaxID=1499689 RepID=UPI000509408A|nr:TVP38/TMEM64 family protein [Clostridium amazonitimonense]